MKTKFLIGIAAVVCIIALYYLVGELNKLGNIENYPDELENCQVREVYDAEVTDKNF